MTNRRGLNPGREDLTKAHNGEGYETDITFELKPIIPGSRRLCVGIRGD